jgi:hypothetical protein
MAKFNYFDTLETLSDLMEQTVREVFGVKNTSPNSFASHCKATEDANKMICELEAKLFSDFFPPLERADIAAFAHSLGRATATAASMERGRRNRISPSEGEICIKLAGIINQNAHMLKKIRKTDGIPNRDCFRELLKSGEEQRTRNSAYVKAGEARSPSEEMTRELSVCFDRLVEIMLNNI